MTAHHRFWPKGLSHDLRVPQVTLNHYLDTAAQRYPDKPAIIYGGAVLTYRELKARVDALAGYLQQRLGVRPGDRVLLASQNCPQFVIGFYAALRAQAAVVPVSPMSTATEVRYYASDSGARVALVAQELLPQFTQVLTLQQHGASTSVRAEPVEALPQSPGQALRQAQGERFNHRPAGPFKDDRQSGLDALLVHAYSDAIASPAPDDLPDMVLAPRAALPSEDCHGFADALAQALTPASSTATPDDLCVLPYTSGTTGHPKGCMHTHRTVLASNIGSQLWRGLNSDAVFLCVAPLFHMLGLQNGMNMPMTLGGTVVMMPRWHAPTAIRLIEQHRITVWTAPPAMVIDFFAQPEAMQRDLSSLALLSGGGAAMPEAVAKMLAERFGLFYNEAYGLSETAAFLHANPLARGKRQCLGVPTQGVESRIVDPVTLDELPQGEVGELVTSGQQVMLGYWRNPQADAAAFFERDGKRFFRTGDLAHVDEDGYYFMRDRLKRMINVSGYKVWPAEIENTLYEHPAVLEACVIAEEDERRGESVTALIVRKAGHSDATEEQIIAWSRERMAAYKAPRRVEFVPSLLKSGTGKILWRELQEARRRSNPNQPETSS